MFKNFNLCVSLSFVNVIISLLVVFLDLNFSIVKLSIVISLIIFIILLKVKLGNFLYFIRTLFLGFIGYFPVLVKLLNGPDAFFSPYEFSTQSLHIALLMYVGTALALLGNEIGLMCGHKNYTQLDHRVFLKFNDDIMWKLVYFFSVPFCVVFSLLVAQSNGPFVFYSGYAGAQNTLVLGSIPSIAVFFLLLSYTAINKANIRHGRKIVCALAIFLFLASNG